MNGQPVLMFLGGAAAWVQPGEYSVTSVECGLVGGRGRVRRRKRRVKCLVIVPVLYSDVMARENQA